MSEQQRLRFKPRRFRPWQKTAYVQRLEREIMIARAALAEEKGRREAAERKLARRWTERPTYPFPEGRDKHRDKPF